MFTKKHYKAIAEIIENRVGDGFTGEDYDRGWHDAAKSIAAMLADYFAKDNSRFNRERFLTACGL